MGNSQPEQIAAIANQGYAQVILSTAFTLQPQLKKQVPQDLLLYFSEMRRANRVRNTQAKAQLAEIGALLGKKGIPVVTLKGAADVLKPLHDEPAHRYISDLDLLVPENRLSEAALILRKAKGLPATQADISPGAHHHLAQITHPDWPFTVELHLRPGSDAVCSVLNSDTMLNAAEPTSLDGIAVPDMTDRFLHHVLHGMELRHPTAALNLRTTADHLMYLDKADPKIVEQALTRLESAGKADWLHDLTALAAALKGNPPTTESWAAAALSSFGNPEEARSRDTVFWMRRYAKRALQDPAYRKQLMRKAISPDAWVQFLKFHRERRGRFK